MPGFIIAKRIPDPLTLRRMDSRVATVEYRARTIAAVVEFAATLAKKHRHC